MLKCRALLVDIDGLRPDVFTQALAEGRLEHTARMLGGPNWERSVLIPVLAPAPSITFASQACLFTGTHPAQHGIPGNEFFDRFGLASNGKPRHYAFDVGDTLAADDAVRVFTDGLASRSLQVPTLYEMTSSDSRRSVVSGHMYARGAGRWLRPSLLNLARLTKGKNLFGLSAARFDRQTLKNTLAELDENGVPELLTVYFMGIDHESHAHGPQAQAEYLTGTLDPYLGELWAALESALPSGEGLPIVAIFSDHGHIAVPNDDPHSLRLGFPFDQEIAPFFDALGLDVHDYPGEDPHSDAVIGLNGGVALVYRRSRTGGWQAPPDFQEEILPVGQAFWEAHTDGLHAPKLQGTLAGVLVRDVEHYGWQAPYSALAPTGDLVPLETWFREQPSGLYADPVHRLQNLAGPQSGDLLLISDYARGYYFGNPQSGIHGGLHPEDSQATLAIGWPGAPEIVWNETRAALLQAIQYRCRIEGGRRPSTADLWTALQAIC